MVRAVLATGGANGEAKLEAGMLGKWFYGAANLYGWAEKAGIDSYGGMLFAAVLNSFIWFCIRVLIFLAGRWSVGG